MCFTRTWINSNLYEAKFLYSIAYITEFHMLQPFNSQIISLKILTAIILIAMWILNLISRADLFKARLANPGFGEVFYLCFLSINSEVD